MVIAFISVLAAIFLALYVSKCQDYKVLERDNKWLKEQRERTPDPVSVDDMDVKPLDERLVIEAIKYNGYVPGTDEGCVAFMIQGERYFIRTDRLPYFMLEKPYSINPEDYDMALFRQSASKVTEELFIGKVQLSEDGKTLRFQADAYEPTYGHCRDSLGCYLNIIHEMQRRLHEVYEGLKQQKENQKQLATFGYRTDEFKPGENKILS